MPGFLKKKYLFPLIILGLYLLVAIYRLEDIPPPWYDESVYLNMAQHVAVEDRISCDFYSGKFKEGKIFNCTPLQYLLLGLYIKIFGLSLFGTRLLYVLLSLIILYCTYLLAKRMFNKRIALYSLLSLASSYTFFQNSRQNLPQVPAAMFAIIAILVFHIAKEKSLGLLFCTSGFLTGLAYLSHPIGIGIFFIISMLFFYNKINFKFFLLYLFAVFIVVLPYILYVMSDFQEYLHQTNFVLKGIYTRQSLFLNILDEIPVRYLELPSLETIFTTPGRGNGYLRQLRWMITHVDLRIYLCEVTGKALLLLSLVYLGLKKLKARRQKELFLIAGLYFIFLSFHPNKFNAYIYVISPYLAICFAIWVNDLLIPRPLSKRISLKAFIAVSLITVFFASNLLFIYKQLSTKRVNSYTAFIKEVTNYIPKGSRVAGPVYFWLGMQKDYRFISATKIVYETDKILSEKYTGITFKDLSREKQENIIRELLNKYKIEYALITIHYWEDVTENPGLALGLGNALRRYLFYNAKKEKDFLKANYYQNIPEAKRFEDEVYSPPSDGCFYNISSEYQDSLKIYKIR